MTIMLKPSQDAGFNSLDDFGPEQHEGSFSSRLDVLQESMRDRILAAPESQQAKLVSLMASWARRVADDPLAKSSTTHAAAVSTNPDTKNVDYDDDYSYDPNIDDNSAGHDDKPTAFGV